jgi:hypothetical protein
VVAPAVQVNVDQVLGRVDLMLHVGQAADEVLHLRRK